MGQAACGQALIEGSKDGVRFLALHFSLPVEAWSSEQLPPSGGRMATAARNRSDCSSMYMMISITSHTVWVAFPLCRVSFNKRVFNFNAECIGLFSSWVLCK